MTPFERFERAKAAVMDTREALTHLDRRPSGAQRRELLQRLEVQLRHYRAAVVALKASGQPLAHVDFLRQA
jgi:hypothetical protein